MYWLVFKGNEIIKIKRKNTKNLIQIERFIINKII